MLNELIESIGFENINQELINSYSRTNSIYVKLASNPQNNIYFSIDKEVIKKNQIINQLTTEEVEQLKWFKKRENLSLWINSNKAIDCSNPYGRKITSNNKYAIIFSYENFKKVYKGDVQQHIKNAIKNYLKILDSLELNEKYTYAIDYIMKNYSEEDLIKRKVKIFMDLELDVYIDLNKRYLEKALANTIKDKFLENYLDQTNQIIYTGFSIVGNKLFLGNLSMPIKELGIMAKEDAVKQENLKKYLESKSETKLIIENIEITKDFKEKSTIQNFRYIDNLQKDIFEEKNLVIKFKEYNSGKEILTKKIISSRNELKKYLYYFLGDEVNKYSTIIDGLETNREIGRFTKRLNEIFLKLENASKNDYSKMNSVVAFEVSIIEYFKEKYLNMRFENMYEKFSGKLSKYQTMDFNNSKEMSYVLGQLIRYVRNNVKNKTKFNFLKNYLYNYRIKHILKLLDMDLKRYKTNQRTLSVLAEINEYVELFNIQKVDEISFKKGMFDSKNMFYVKGEETNE